MIAFTTDAQSFLQSYSHATGLNLGRSEAIEDLGFSSLSSPALSLDQAQWQISSSFRQFSFGDYGLRNMQAGFKKEIFQKQHMGLQAQYTGNSAAGILQLSALYGRSLFDNLNIGIQFNYGQLNVIHYESVSNMTIDLALSSEALPGLYLGAWVRNLFRVKGESLENASLLVSAKYHINPEFRVYASFYKTVISELEIGTGLYYRIMDQLDLKLAYHSTQSAFTLGFGLHFDNKWGIHSAGHLHSDLGMQPALGAYYQKNR